MVAELFEGDLSITGSVEFTEDFVKVFLVHWHFKHQEHGVKFVACQEAAFVDIELAEEFLHEELVMSAVCFLNQLFPESFDHKLYLLFGHTCFILLLDLPAIAHQITEKLIRWNSHREIVVVVHKLV